jgi:hypothetical protein
VTTQITGSTTPPTTVRRTDDITPDACELDYDAATVTKLEQWAGDADTAYCYKRTMLRLYGQYDIRARRAVATCYRHFAI